MRSIFVSGDDVYRVNFRIGNARGRQAACKKAKEHVKKGSPAAKAGALFLSSNMQFDHLLASLSDKEQDAAEVGWMMGMFAAEFVESDARIGLVTDLLERARLASAGRAKGPSSRKGKSKLDGHEKRVIDLYRKHGGAIGPMLDELINPPPGCDEEPIVCSENTLRSFVDKLVDSGALRSSK